MEIKPGNAFGPRDLSAAGLTIYAIIHGLVDIADIHKFIASDRLTHYYI